MKRHTTRKQNRKAKFIAIWWALMQLRYNGTKRGQTLKIVKQVKQILRKLRTQRYETQLKHLGASTELAEHAAEWFERFENSLHKFQKDTIWNFFNLGGENE